MKKVPFALRQKILYGMNTIGNGTYGGFNNAILPLWLQNFTGSPFLIDYLGNTSTVEGVVLQPLIGRWSDGTTSRLGRRRPFIMTGIPLAVFFLFLMPVLGHLRHQLALPLLVAAIILFSITWNVAGDPTQALLADITTPEERPTYNSILTVVGLAAQVVIIVWTALAGIKKNNIPDADFVVAGVVLLLSYALVLLVREPAQAQEMAARTRAMPWHAYVTEIRTFREAFKLLLSVFFFWTGLNAFKPLITTLPIKLVHATKSESLIVYAVLLVATLVFAYPFGRLAQRYRSRRLIVVGTILLILAALWGLFIPSYVWFFPLAILAGCGFSATTVLTYPYLTRLIPESRVGVFTGLQTAFSAAAVPLAALLVGTLVDHFGYRSVFALLAVMMVVDVLFLLAIDDTAASEQVSRAVAIERETAQVVGTALA